MKKIIGISASATALFFASYYGVGLMTAYTLKHNLKSLVLTQGVSVDIDAYHQGLFSSDMTLLWQFQVPQHWIKNKANQSSLLPEKTYTVKMPVHIMHGPVINDHHHLRFGLAYAHTEFHLPEAYREAWMKGLTQDSNLPSLDLSLFVTYLNKMDVHVNVPKFHWTMKEDQSTLMFSGLQSEHTFSSDLSEIEGDVILEGMQFSKAHQVAVLGKVNSLYDFHQTPLGLYLGDATISAPSFKVSEGQKVLLQVEGFQLNSSSDLEDGLLTSSLQGGFEKMMREQEIYGPGRFHAVLKNLDAETWVAMHQKMSSVQHASESERQQAMLKILPDLPKLFSKGTIIDVSELNMMSPEGEVDATLHVVLPKAEGSHPIDLAQKISGEGRFKCPSTWLRNMMIDSEGDKLRNVMPKGSTEDEATFRQRVEHAADEAIQRMLNSGLLVQQEHSYVVQMTLSSGKVLVNGHPLTAEMLKL